MTLQIGGLSKKANVNRETIRYYERLGLIPEPNRTDAGYRIYSDDTVERLRFIKRMQELDFTLKETDKFLAIVDGNKAKCRDMHQFSKEKLKEVQQKILDLKLIETMLTELHTCCHSPDQTDLFKCSIIDSVLGKQK